MYVASSPLAEFVNLDNLSVALLRMAFLRASARACTVDILSVKVVEQVGERAKVKLSAGHAVPLRCRVSCREMPMILSLRLKVELARHGWLEEFDPFVTILPDELNDKEPPPTVPPRRPADPSVLDLLTNNAAAGREAEEMLKTGCQCVSVSVTPGQVRNGSSFLMVLTRRV